MSEHTSSFDPAEFRRALGAFATGVTIITTRDADGKAVGLTANSFNSVSLNPPLVLWSLAETSMSLPAFRSAQHWAVHILAADQESLSTRFARRGEDKFTGLDCDTGTDGIPLLRGCSARFVCRTAFQYEGGDHVIFVGQVLEYARSDAAPLLFHAGRYADAAKREAVKPRSAYLAGSFSEDFLGYLLGRSHFHFFGRIRTHLASEGLSDEEFYLLSSLTLKETLTAQELQAGMADVLDEHGGQSLQSLLRRGFVRAAAADNGSLSYQLTAEGKASALRVISAAKAVESQLLDRLGPGEGAVLKSLLNRLLAVSDPAVSALWDAPQIPNSTA